MKTNILRKRIVLGLLTSGLAISTLAGSVMAADEEIYDLGSSTIITSVQKEPERVEAIAPEAEPKHDIVSGGQVARSGNYGMLGNRDSLTTPFTVTSFTNQAIADTQAQTVNELIENDASTSNQTLSSASQAWSIRGFRSTQQDVSFNGLYGVAPRFYSGIEGVERVELLKGPAALLYGMAPNGRTSGGNINYVPKHAQGGKNQNSLTLAYGDGKQFSQNLDISERSLDNKWGLRLNAFHTNGSGYFPDEMKKATSTTIGLDRKGSHSRFSLDLGYAFQDVENPQYRVTLNKGQQSLLPSADHNKNYGGIGTYRDITEKYGVARYEYDFNKNLMGYVTAGMRITDLNSITSSFKIMNTDWNKTGSVNSQWSRTNSTDKSNSQEVGLRGKFNTGSLKHELIFAVNRYDMRVDRLKGANITKKNISFTSPEWGFGYTGDGKPGTNTWNRARHTGAALTDVMTTADDKWTFIVGGRYQKIKESTYEVNHNKGTVTDTLYDTHAWTPAFGLVYKVSPSASVYANYIEGLAAGDIVGSGYANEGQMLSPYKTKQYEVGAKFDFGRYLATLSAFVIRQNGAMDDNENGQTYLRSSEVRHRGIEASIMGEPIKGTRVMAGLMFLDATYMKATDKNGGNYAGKREFGIPRWTSVIRVEQDIKGVKGLSLNTRLTYNGSAYYNSANNVKVPQWIRWDLGAKYEFTGWGHPMIIRADVYNVMNKSYWIALQDNNGLFTGKGRTGVISLETKF